MRYSPLVVALALLLAGAAVGHSELTITDEIHVYEALRDTDVRMYGASELHLSDETDPLPGSVVKIYSENAWLFFESVKPSRVAATIFANCGMACGKKWSRYSL